LTSNKNNSNQTQSQQPEREEQQTNKFQHFIPGFAKRREIYNKTPPVRSGRQFPYIKEPLEYAYEKFISEVVNPSASTYYPKTDENNRPTPMHDNVNCKRIVLRIVRHRLSDGSEYLTSFSQIIGHDVYGNKKTFPCDSPERITKPIFSIVKEYSIKKKQIVAYSEGPIGQEEVYEMPFTAENYILFTN
jgi:hypothetical protein